MNEFDFIRTYLASAERDRSVLLGIGDDAAIVRPDTDRDLCISSDMLLAERHFFANDAPQDVAHKILAVNLSDMAAMGAVPRWVLLSDRAARAGRQMAGCVLPPFFCRLPRIRCIAYRR